MGKQRSAALENFYSSVAKQPQEGLDTTNVLAGSSAKFEGSVNEQELANLDDTLYDRQSTGEALKNTLVKAVGKTVLRGVDMIGGLAGAVAELPDYLADGGLGYTGDDDNKKRKGFSGFLDLLSDNMYSQSITRPAEQYLDDNFQVYQNKEQQESYLGMNMGNLDKLLDGVSYVAGMALGFGGKAKAITLLPKLLKSGAITAKEVGELAKIANISGKKGLSFLDNITQTGAKIKDLLKTSSSKTKGLSDFGDELLGGFTESAAEAVQTKEQIKKNKTEQLLAQTGQTELTEEQANKIESEAQAGAGTNFVVNLITTTLANAIVFKPLLNTKWAKNIKSIDDELSVNKSLITKADDGAYKIAEKSKKWYNNALSSKYGQGIVKNAVIEGGQEVSQFYSNDYITNLLSEPHDETVDNMADMFSLSSEKYIDTMKKTNSNLSSVDAVQSGIIGAIIGGGITSLTTRNKYKQIDANTSRLVQEANDKTITGKDYQSFIRLSGKSLDHSQVADGATINGDKHTAKDHENLAAINYILSRQAIGKTDDIIEQFEKDKELSDKTFNEKYGFDKPIDPKDKIEILDNLIDTTRKIDKSSKEILSNYGAKINQLRKIEGNENMLSDIVTLDVFQQKMQDRLDSLEKKFTDNGVTSWKELTGKAITKEEVAERESELGNLRKQITDLQQDKTIDTLEKLKQINELQTKLVEKQDLLNNSVSEANVLDLYSRNVSDEYLPENKEDVKSFKYEKYSNDLKDYRKIHEAKNKVVDYLAQIVNDESHYAKVAKEIKNRKLDERTVTDFTLRGNQITNPKLDKEGKPVLNDDGTPQTELEYKYDKDGVDEHLIQSGQVFNLRSKINKRVGGKYINGETVETVEVTKLFYKDGLPYVNVLNTEGGFNNKGRNIPLALFKRNVVNINNKEGNLVHDYQSEGISIWKKFKNKVVLYKTPDGKYIKGKIALSDTYTDDKGSLRNTDMFRIAYFDESTGRMSFINGVTKFDLENNVKEIYSDERSYLESLRIYSQTYLDKLLKELKINEEKKQDNVTKLESAKQEKANTELAIEIAEKQYFNSKKEVKKTFSKENQKKHQETYNNLLKQLEATEKSIEELELLITKADNSIYNQEFIQEATETYSELRDLDIDAESLPDSLRELYDNRNQFNTARAEMRADMKKEVESDEEKIVLEEEGQNLDDVSDKDLLFNQLQKTVNSYNDRFPDNQIDLDKNTYGESLNLIYNRLRDAIKSNRDNLEDNTEADTELYENWKKLIDTNKEVYDRYKEQVDKFYNSISEKAGFTEDKARQVKNIQLRLLSKFYTWTNKKGFYYDKLNTNKISAKTQVNNNNVQGSVFNNEDYANTVNAFRNTDINETINPDRLEEKRNFHNLAYKLNHQTEFSVQITDDDIYLTTVEPESGKVLGVYLEKNAKNSKLRNDIKEAWEKDNNIKITSIGKMSLYDIPVKEENETDERFAERIKPFQKSPTDVEIGNDAEIVIGKNEQLEIGGYNIELEQGRGYMISRENGTTIPLLLNTLDTKVTVTQNGKPVQISVTDLLSHAIVSFEKAADNGEFRNFSTVTNLFRNFLYYVDSIDKLQERINDKGSSPALIRKNENGIWEISVAKNGTIITTPLTERNLDGEISITKEGKDVLDSRLLNINDYLVKENKINVETLGYIGSSGYKLQDDYLNFLAEAGTSVSLTPYSDINGTHLFHGSKFSFNDKSLVQPSKPVVKSTTTVDETLDDDFDPADFASTETLGKASVETETKKPLSETAKRMLEVQENEKDSDKTEDCL